MNEESKNWFRISKLLIEVGADVLQRLVVDNIQTSFLNELEYCWIAKVDKVKHRNYAKILWNSFKQDLADMDETCKIHIRPLHKNWKLRENQNLTLSEQVPIFQKWVLDIETSLSPFLKKELTNMGKTLQSPINQKLKRENYIETPASTKLFSWLEQVHDSLNNVNFLSDSLQNLSTTFLELCQQSRKNMLREIKNHFDDFISSSTDNVLHWDATSKEKMKDNFTNLESDRNKMLQSWKNVSDSFVKSLGQDIKDLLISIERSALLTDTSQLTKLCSDLKTVADEIDGTELQKSCDTWHQELHTLIDTWLVKTDSIQFSSHIRTRDSFFHVIKSFSSISSKQVNDFFVSKIGEKELNKLKESKQLSEEQYLKLWNFRNLDDLQTFGSTLVFIVFKIFLLYPPTYGWNEEPPEFDLSLSAEIVRLRSFRNIIIERSEKASITQSEFDTLWLRVQNVLCRLAAGSGNEYERNVRLNVDHLKTCSFSPERESELKRVLDWCRGDIFAEFKGLAQTHRCLYILDSVQKAETERSRREDEDRLRRQQEEEMERLRRENERLRKRNEELLKEEQEEESFMPTTVSEGIRKGYNAGGPVVAAGGAILGMVGGLGRTLFKE